jgi:hypothetical protein
MSDGEYAKIHWIPAGSFPTGESSARFNDAVPPGVVTPDDNDKESDWPNAASPDTKDAIRAVAHFSVGELMVAKW